MPRVSLISDFGTETHYPVLLKIRLLETDPSIDLIEITHHIEPFNILEAAQILKATYLEFPANSIHLIAIDSSLKPTNKVLVYQIQSQWFVSVNESLLELIAENLEVFRYSVQLPESITGISSTFSEKYYFPFVLQQLLSEKPENFLKPEAQNEKIANLQPVVEKDRIRATVLYVDSYGNAIVNLTKKQFHELARNRPFQLFYHQSSFLEQISLNYHHVESGEHFAVFNDSDYLEIGIREGNGAKLLGMRQGSAVMIFFRDKTQKPISKPIAS